MTREELEHIIRASADVTDQYEFVIIGSQSIFGPVPHPEDVFTMSAEADIYPLHAPELAEKIEGALGEGSGCYRYLRHPLVGEVQSADILRFGYPFMLASCRPCQR